MEKNARGWIVVSRKLTESWAWQDAARLRRWLALLFAVNFADQKVEVHGEMIVVHQGCSLMTDTQLGKIWGCSRASAIRFLKDLMAQDMVDIIVTKCKKKNIRIIMVKNYNKYQQKSNNLKPYVGVDTKLDTNANTKPNTNVNKCNPNDIQSINQKTLHNMNRKPNTSSELKVGKKADTLKQYINKKQENQLTADESKASRQADFISWFNGKVQNARIPKIRLFTEAREKAVAQIWTQFGADSVNEVVSRAAVSPFLNGEGKKHFVATFDWIFKPENFLKILEGNFDARKY
jgi:hypothetical protein